MRKKTGVVLLVVCLLAASAMLVAAFSPAFSPVLASNPAVVTNQNTNCTCKVASITTTNLGQTTIGLGQVVTDNATVTAMTGNGTPTGMVSFQVSFENGTWMTFDSNVTLVNGSAVSMMYMPTLKGNYSFQAIYSGDGNFQPSTSAAGSEKLLVTAGPGIPGNNSVTMTNLGVSSILLGQSVTDNATVMAAEGRDLSGSIDFMVSYNGGPWMAYDINVTLVNGSTTSVYYTPNATGSYAFKANFSGNDDILPSSSANGSEILTVSSVVPPQANSTTTTWLGANNIMLNQSVTDNATITAAPGANLSGTVDFWVQYNEGPWMIYDANVTVVNATATSVFYTPNATGLYEFQAVYSGNSHTLGSASGEDAEMLNVTSVAPPVCRCITVGEAVTDNATVMGLGGGFPGPTGTVDFQVSFENGTWMTYDANVTLVNGTAVSIQYIPMAAGNYMFRAVYSGDSNYLPSMSGDSMEPLCVKVVTQNSTTTTMLSSSNISLGNSIIDNATVSGVLLGSPIPTGTVDFQVSYNGGNWTTFDTNVTLVNGTASSMLYTPLAAGNYSFRAVYSGSSLFNPSMSANDAERLLVTPGPAGGKNGSGVVTMLSQSNITLGMNVTDTATVSGLGGSFPVPTGTVTFQVSFMNGTWTTYDANVTLVNGTAVSTVYIPMAAGDYMFRAVYSGDSNYLGAISGNANEALIVLRAGSTTTTNLGVCVPQCDCPGVA